MRTLTVATVNLPAERVDLAEWFFALSNASFRAASSGHLGLGHYRGEDGRRGALLVEHVGGLLITHYYDEQIAEPDRLHLISETRGWLLNVLPLGFTVLLGLSLRPVGAGHSELRQHISVDFHHWFFALGARVPLLPYLIARHNQEEVIGFATDLERKFG